ncbi:MAG: GNAT family N-acetyltransferase [Myxococcota bacterium]
MIAISARGALALAFPWARRTTHRDMAMVIREFCSADYAEALKLWETTEGMGLSEADSFEGISRLLERNPGCSFVALDEEVIVGTILCGHDGRRGFIYHLAVAVNHRRAGLARRLVGCALEALRAARIDKCHVLVFRENELGRAFWAGIGAEERVRLTQFSLPTKTHAL